MWQGNWGFLRKRKHNTRKKTVTEKIFLHYSYFGSLLHVLVKGRHQRFGKKRSFKPACLCTERMSCTMSPLLPLCFHLYLQCRQLRFSWSPALLQFKGPAHRVWWLIVMFLPSIETFYTKAESIIFGVFSISGSKTVSRQQTQKLSIARQKGAFRCVDSISQWFTSCHWQGNLRYI